eukprot:2006308-Pleurochrysis_carterae.AAC.1
MAEVIMKNDAAGARSEQPKRAAAVTGRAKVQVAMASVRPTSAMVSAIAETNAKAVACISNVQRRLRAIEAEASRK